MPEHLTVLTDVSYGLLQCAMTTNESRLTVASWQLKLLDPTFIFRE